MIFTIFLCASNLFNGIHAQSGPDCPLPGPAYPIPTAAISSPIISNASATLKTTLDQLLANSTLGAANATFYVTAFSADDVIFDYGYESPANDGSLTAGALNRNTIFRIGSVSKFMTVYTLLAATGLKYVNDPVAKWVPELAAAGSTDGSDIETTHWEDITIGALAGHMAGILKDYNIGDITALYNMSTIQQIGLPSLPKDETPTCGSDPHLRACSRDEFFAGLGPIHPVTSVFNMPIYSNPAFQILAYALEAMTKKPFADVFEDSITRPLNLTSTYLSTPPISPNLNAIIPGDEIESWWKIDVGDDMAPSAQGWMVSTPADIAVVGQSILRSSLLRPVDTRRWLKPTASTTDLRINVGLSWEILRVELPVPNSNSSTRLMDLYTKNGGGGAYFAQFALDPEHGMGFAVFVAGRPPPEGQPDLKFGEMQKLNFLVTETFAPAFEELAMVQAKEKFAGTYADEEMTMTLVAGDGRRGVGVTNWTSLGDQRDLLASYFAALAGIFPNTSIKPSLRLYPVGLSSSEDGKIAFRGVLGVLSDQSVYSLGDKPFSRACGAWGGVGEPPYGNIGLDDFVFEVDGGGMATGVEVRGVRRTLKRVT